MADPDAQSIYVKPVRGQDMTRLETFTDAAFAFAVTLLAISIDQIPTNYQELIDALKGAPAFAASFALLLIYWRAHHAWSKQFGLDDVPSMLLTAFLIFLVLIYVYPLKILFSLAFSAMSNGWLPSNFNLDSFERLRVFFTIYGLGFLAMNVAIALLYGYARTQRKALAMCDQEAFNASIEACSWLGVGLFAVLSIILAWTMSDEWVPLASWAYMLLAFYGPISYWISARMERKRFPATTA
ncbi:MAG: TMEM175 family protein [Pseudomonadota bacterium]